MFIHPLEGIEPSDSKICSILYLSYMYQTKPPSTNKSKILTVIAQPLSDTMKERTPVKLNVANQINNSTANVGKKINFNAFINAL